MSAVIIAIDGTDYTADVLFESAHFEMQVNGIAGSASLRIRDEDRTKSFTVGDPLTLQIDGEMVWRGYVGTVNRIYVFPALNVTEFGLARFIDITGTDVNVLFTKRFVFNQSTPADILAPLLPAHYPDDDAIATLIADWIDLTGDGLDTSSHVENVGDTTWTQEGRAWEGSDSWGQAMSSIANLPAAIYYIDPDLNLVYTDVDTPNAPFGLSDQYNGTTTKGYSEMEVLMDGSGLANDVLAWGIGYGSQTPVFTRDEDAASQAAHGLWQLAQTTFGVYKQATIERIAASIIDGSPQSKRGSKDDKVAVMCVTYEPGLRVAQKVDFTSNVFGFNDVIPIRKMEIDFPGPETPKYTLVLSHEIDTPFSFFDPFLLDLGPLPKVKVHIPNIPIPGPITCPVGCVLASCAWDDFDRTVAAPDWGGDWDTTSSNAAGGGISGGVPNMADVAFISKTRSTTVTYNEAGTRVLDVPCDDTSGPWDFYVAWTADGAFNSYVLYSNPAGLVPPGTYNFPGAIYEFDVGTFTTIPQQFLQFWFVTALHGSSPNNPSLLRIAMSGGAAAWTLGNLGLSSSFNTPTSFSFTPGNLYKAHVQLSADGSTRANMWDSTFGDEPPGWAVTRTATSGTEDQNRPVGFGTAFVRGLQAGSLATNPVNNSFDFPAVKVDLQCGDFVSRVEFENFTRTEVNQWGNATPSGYTWVIGNPGDAFQVSVNGSQGVIAHESGSPEFSVFGHGPWSMPEWTMESQFTVGTIGTGQSDYLRYRQSSGSARILELWLATDGTGYIGLDGDTGSAQQTFAFVSGSTYKVRWHFVQATNDSEAKIWLASDPEPSSWTVTNPFGPPDDGSPTGFIVGLSLKSPSSGYTYTHLTDYITFETPCFPGGPNPTQIPSLNAYICENQIAHGSDIIVTTHAFLPNSSSVWVNGILQPQPVYIENPTGKSITLGFTPSSGSAIRVCYYSVP